MQKSKVPQNNFGKFFSSIQCKRLHHFTFRYFSQRLSKYIHAQSDIWEELPYFPTKRKKFRAFSCDFFSFVRPFPILLLSWSYFLGIREPRCLLRPSPSGHRCSPCPWLSLRESWREAPERAHRTDSTQKLPTEPPHRFLIRNCIPPRTVCTSLSPSLREVPRPSGEARGCAEASSRSIKPHLPPGRRMGLGDDRIPMEVVDLCGNC